MTSINDGIKFKDYEFDNDKSQIGGEKTKTEKVNYSDGLTKKEAQKIDKRGNNDGTITEDEFVEACLEDDTTKDKSESDLKALFKQYFASFLTKNKSVQKEDEPKVKHAKNSNIPESLSFGKPKVSISGIKSGKKKGEYYNEMKMGDKTYKKTSSKTNKNGIETYIMEPEPKDGSKIVIERDADGVQYFTVFGTDKKATSQLHLDKNGDPRSIFRYNDGKAYEREYFKEKVVRRYERDDKGNLVSSMDYNKKKDGTLDTKKPISKQTYTDVEDMGKQWATRTVFEYDKDGKQSVKQKHKYDYDQEKDNEGKYTGKMKITEKIYKGDSEKDEDLISEETTEQEEGVVKKTTKKTVNPDGTSTTVITEGDTKTVIEKDEKGEITSKKVTKDGITKTTTYKDGKEVETTEEKSKDDKDNPKIDPEKAISALQSNGYSKEDAEEIARAIFGDKSSGKTPEKEITKDDAAQKIKQIDKYKNDDDKIQDIVKIIFGK